MATRSRDVVLRFLAAPTDVSNLGSIHSGRILQWIDNAAYACAVAWASSYCVTAYVGNVRFDRPIESGHLVEVSAELIYTGRSSMHIRCVVSSADPRGGSLEVACSCLVIFVAIDENSRPVPVPQWEPSGEQALAQAEVALVSIGIREDVQNAMSQQRYTPAGTAPESLMRFLAAPTDVNWGGKVHGGTAMRWIDEAAYLCGSAWSGAQVSTVYAGGVRFYRPIPIGDVVEVRSRLLHTGKQTIHVSVHVYAGDPRTLDMHLTTHCLSVVACLGADGRPTDVRQWEPVTEEDFRLDKHARDLISYRAPLIGAQYV
jgi:acyl-CoA hydrolase